MLPKKYEIELTSACNAGCPACKRTILIDKGEKFAIETLTYDDIVDIFQDVNMFGAKVKFCGVLGDPIANKDLFDITEFFVVEKGVGEIEVSTNAGLKTADWWKRYGEISKRSRGVLQVHFAIDGFTRNDYRVNVGLEKAMENMEAYVAAGGSAIWQYIIFDYNKHEVDLARQKAKDLGIGFATRTAWRNDSTPKEKAEIQKKAVERTYEQPHIDCQHMKSVEIYVGANKTVWPCCYLYDEYVTKGLPQSKVFSLKEQSLVDILDDPWFNGYIEQTFDKDHPQNMPRCWKSCGDKGIRKNQKNVESEAN